MSDLAGPFQLSRPTIRDYVTLLERVFLLEHLPPWHVNRLSRLVKTPKLHLGDTGVASALLGLDAAALAQDQRLRKDKYMLFVMRHMIVTLALLAGASTAAETEPLPPSDTETITRKPSARPIPLAPRLRFEPKADMTPQELEQLGPYLKGKPLYPEDEKALGAAMRHLREIK